MTSAKISKITQHVRLYLFSVKSGQRLGIILKEIKCKSAGFDTTLIIFFEWVIKVLFCELHILFINS